MHDVKVYRRLQYKPALAKTPETNPLLPPGANVEVQQVPSGYMYEVVRETCLCDCDGECSMAFSSTKGHIIGQLEALISGLREAIWRLQEDKFNIDEVRYE